MLFGVLSGVTVGVTGCVKHAGIQGISLAYPLFSRVKSNGVDYNPGLFENLYFITYGLNDALIIEANLQVKK
jgi:hypothetical protein